MDNFNEQINFYKETIENINYGINQYKLLEIISLNEYNNCIENLENVSNMLTNIELSVNDLQYINNNLSSIIKNYGVYDLNRLIIICLGNNFIKKNVTDKLLIDKLEILKKYLHPINYKILNWTNKSNNKTHVKKSIVKTKLIDDKMLIEDSNMFECLDLMRTSTNYYLRIHGIKLIIHSEDNKMTLCINCILNNLFYNNIDNNFILNGKKDLKNYIKDINNDNNELFIQDTWLNYYENISLKEYLVYNSEELYNRYIHLMTQKISIEQKPLNTLVQEFIGLDLFGQRNMILNLLMNNNKIEFEYISYLLFDLLSNDNLSGDYSIEQKKLYDNFSYNYKKKFKNAMYKTIEYTSTLFNFDNNKIPLEQQICLMKANDNVKEKAMQKLKEIKSKSEDSGSKARQYLDGLLKIPFGIYKEEYILSKKQEINNLFLKLVEPLNNINIDSISNSEITSFILLIKDLLCKKDYNSLEIINIVNILKENIKPIYSNLLLYILNNLNKKKNYLIQIIGNINLVCSKYNIDTIKIKTNMNINLIKEELEKFLNKNINNSELLKEILVFIEGNIQEDIYSYLIKLERTVYKIQKKNNEVIEYISDFNKILDNAVHGHNNAKKQIERVLGQWINGEKTGYCFGFEGPPGLGKTTLAKKGIANCLKDINNDSRPFSFIALGGSSNGSILDGHNYTYVGSTWGKIVDILIDKKCMNPIIFIDELDKVSRTEHGKEIIGILTHLIDSTQNDIFQDKYFGNVDLDLSKALFIFSYNDVELIDKILLDRIHRIKFDNLILEDKIIICEKYLLPELYKKFGIENIINIDEKVIIYLIEKFTNEPGVRKLKEILYEIISTINLDLLKKKEKYDIPFVVTEDIVNNILKDRNIIKFLSINTIPKIGIINGLWANSYGNGGILHIEAKYFLTNTLFDLKLTGMQGDIMKESMAVAKTLAISLINKSRLNSLLSEFEQNKFQGIHIHVPEGATPKDGPSAGAAITLVLYSLLTNKKIKNNFAITGEICLQGNITAIGGLDLKILGGLKAGVTSFLYPKDNNKDFRIFYDKHKDKLDNIDFYEVQNINEALKYIII